MSMQPTSSLKPQVSSSPRGFTLIELLVVMGIMAILGVLTALSYRGIAKDAKLASGRNTVSAVLDNARALAMKSNRIVVVAFRPRLEGTKEQFVEAVTAQWTGDSARIVVTGFSDQVIDMFKPIPGVPARTLPKGISVAAPQYFNVAVNTDNVWSTLSHLPSGTSEAPGEIIGVMYAPDGTTISHNSISDSNRIFVDFNENGLQDSSVAVVNLFVGVANISQNTYFALSEHHLEADEAYVDVAPFIAVFDDDEARELSKPATWNSAANREAEYTTYVTNNVNPIHFNRYTGVVMK